jgi:hypothetical protein
VQDSFRQARCGICEQLFFVCRRCDRGQAYCGDGCRRAGRRRAQRAAHLRHRRSTEGLLDRRDHQQAYRERLLLRVMDTGSAKLPPSATVCLRVGPTSKDDVPITDPQEC